MDPEIRHYFLTLGFPLINSYGMSESTGPQNFTHPDFQFKTKQDQKEVGKSIPGTEIKIAKLFENEEDGKIMN